MRDRAPRIPRAADLVGCSVWSELISARHLRPACELVVLLLEALQPRMYRARPGEVLGEHESADDLHAPLAVDCRMSTEIIVEAAIALRLPATACEARSHFAPWFPSIRLGLVHAGDLYARPFAKPEDLLLSRRAIVARRRR